MGEWAVQHSPTPPCRLSLADHITISREMVPDTQGSWASHWCWEMKVEKYWCVTFAPYLGVNAPLRPAPGHQQEVTKHREWGRSTWKAPSAQTPCNIRAQISRHQSNIGCIHSLCLNVICFVVSLHKLFRMTVFNNWLQRLWTLAVIKGPHWLLLPWLKPWMPCPYTMLPTLSLEEFGNLFSLETWWLP